MEPGSANVAQCATHPSATAIATCDHCGAFCCVECIRRDGARQVCVSCIDEARVSVSSNPWERRSEIGWFAALWQTVLAVSTEPGAFFRSMAPGGSVGEAALFYALVMIPGLLMGTVYSQLMLAGVGDALFDGLVALGVTAQIPPAQLEQLRLTLQPSTGGMLSGAALNLFLFLPGYVLMTLVVGALQHGALTVMGGQKHELNATLRVAYYAGAVRIWEVVPLLNLVTLPWMFGAQSVGFSRVHETESWKGTVAAWGPYVTCCCCVLAIPVTIGALGALATLR